MDGGSGAKYTAPGRQVPESIGFLNFLKSEPLKFLALFVFTLGHTTNLSQHAGTAVKSYPCRNLVDARARLS